MLARKQQEYFNVFGTHVDPYSTATQRMLESARQGFLASGADPVTAMQRAYAAVSAMVQQQAAMVSFVHLFRLLGIIFMLLLPLILLMRRPRGRPAAGAH
jgi:DHA2 family multidrug resistance protein